MRRHEAELLLALPHRRPRHVDIARNGAEARPIPKIRDYPLGEVEACSLPR